MTKIIYALFYNLKRFYIVIFLKIVYNTISEVDLTKSFDVSRETFTKYFILKRRQSWGK